MPAAADDAIELMVAFVRNVALGRAMFASGIYPHLNFWRVLQGNTMDMAAIDWCKLFGNDDKATQPAHWKNVVDASQHDAFRNGLLSATGLTGQQWLDYRQSVLDYRNTMAAHLDAAGNRPPNYPVFDKAVLAASHYYSHIMADAAMRAAHPHFQPDLIQYEKDFRLQALAVAKVALASTVDIPEKVM